MPEFKKAGESPEFKPLPEGSAELAAMRQDLVTRGSEIASLLSSIGKADPKRHALVDEKLVLDRTLRRVNSALAAAHRKEHQDEPEDVDERNAPIGLTPREEAAVRVACAFMSGPLATTFVKTSMGEETAQDVADAAWEVIDAIMGRDP